VRIEPGVLAYVLKIVRATRSHESILVGAGPRGSIYLLLAAKGRALVAGRDYVIPDDVVGMIGPVLAHRITLTAEAEISGSTQVEVLRSLLDKIDVPR
jgi:MoxR-like ATPase